MEILVDLLAAIVAALLLVGLFWPIPPEDKSGNRTALQDGPQLKVRPRTENNIRALEK